MEDPPSAAISPADGEAALVKVEAESTPMLPANDAPPPLRPTRLGLNDLDLFLGNEDFDDTTVYPDGDFTTDTKARMLVDDLICLHRVLHQLETATSVVESIEHRAELLAGRVVQFIKRGKPYILAGAKDVPRQFLTGGSVSPPGRFIVRASASSVNAQSPLDLGEKSIALPSMYREISEEDAKERLTKLIVKSLRVFTEGGAISAVDQSSYPYADFLKKLPDVAPLAPVHKTQPKDVILIPTDINQVETIDPPLQVANKAVFQLAAQIVTSASDTSEKRVEAAFVIIGGLDITNVVLVYDEDNPPELEASKPGAAPIPNPQSPNPAGHVTVAGQPRSRFLVCAPHRVELARAGDAGPSVDNVVGESWSPLSLTATLEFTLMFVFEVYLEKVSHSVLADNEMTGFGGHAEPKYEIPPSDVPVDEPNEYDVLFGRGGKCRHDRLSSRITRSP
jgi:hypothetical protein